MEPGDPLPVPAALNSWVPWCMSSPLSFTFSLRCEQFPKAPRVSARLHLQLGPSAHCFLGLSGARWLREGCRALSKSGKPQPYQSKRKLQKLTQFCNLQRGKERRGKRTECSRGPTASQGQGPTGTQDPNPTSLKSLADTGREWGAFRGWENSSSKNRADESKLRAVFLGRVSAGTKLPEA